MSVDPDDHTPGKIFAPWGPDVTAVLNRYQERGPFHPFTCGRGQSRRHAGGVSLVATDEGWHCPHDDCDYTQGWAWAFMTRENDSDR